ncbi:outer membrane homotrimeric porin [Pseudodesulfovibrio sediminis]|uniref:Uncharacterized protein n=1 Tax=Pseudodesulfovibrio sediminis TaxID=2810563 RepID=A0ABN6ER57_9BACT|nr:outer membrane homotrimeric porin [Pseudodesulfovibrio sediminis]BCS87700.1 hypothetical protein PSDVSF_09420 [Pseudodesulfovibrio sediminis]
MKRLTLLAVALVMVLGMAVSASAAPEVTISGNVLVNAIWKSNWDFTKNSSNKAMEIRQRADLYFTATANENLKAVIGLRSVKGTWGQGEYDNDTAGSGTNSTLSFRDVYIDYNWPGTEVNIKTGLYNVALPTAVGGGSQIMAGRVGAMMVSAPLTENVSVLGGYARVTDNDTEALTQASNDMDYLDAYILALPVSLEGVSFSPYVAYGNGGQNYNGGTGDEINAYWIGSDFTMNMFDPFVLKADLAYGNMDAETDASEANGWWFDVALDYTGFDFATMSAYFVYTSGSDDDTSDGAEAMPVIQSDWAVGSFFFGGGGITSDDINGGDTQLGYWILGFSATDIQSFAEGLTHDFHVLYAKGTNDDALADNTITLGAGLTDKDSLWEVDFNTMYQIYDELTLYTQIGYINADYDDDTWAADLQDDAWKFATGMVYQF